MIEIFCYNNIKARREGGSIMPTVNVNIQPEIISWVLSQTQKEKLGDKLLNNIIQWLNGTKTPTFNKAHRSRALGEIYFYLSKRSA